MRNIKIMFNAPARLKCYNLSIPPPRPLDGLIRPEVMYCPCPAVKKGKKKKATALAPSYQPIVQRQGRNNGLVALAAFLELLQV